MIRTQIQIEDRAREVARLYMAARLADIDAELKNHEILDAAAIAVEAHHQIEEYAGKTEAVHFRRYLVTR